MFRAQTVVVVGAGASAELGFPLGNALLRDIANRLDISYRFGQLERGDHVIAQALRSRLDASSDVTDFNEHLHSAWQIVRSSSQGISIDNVLDALEDPKASLVGKFAIVRSILEAEQNSPLSEWSRDRPGDINFATVKDTWLDKITKVLTEGARVSKLNEVFDNLTFINFNYDRTLEQFLPFSIANYLGVRPQAVEEVFSTLPVYRPYGKAGSLPWQIDGRHVPYGMCNSDAVQIAAQSILTFTEQISDRDLMSGMKSAIANADRIIFLGFGFHRQNLALFKCKAQPHLQVLATALGISHPDCEVIAEEVERCLELSEVPTLKGHDFVRLFPLKCDAFMSEVWRTLTAGPGDDPTWEIPSYEPPKLPNWPELSFGTLSPKL